MTPDELLVALFRTLTEHIKLPVGYAWAPTAAFATATAFGLLMLLRGAKWAPGLAAVTFLAIGGYGGTFLAQAVEAPFWPTVCLVGILGFVLGLVMFRLWQAILLASCFVVAGLSIYYVHSLTAEVQNWLTASAEPGLVTLQPAGAVVGENRPSATAELQSLWRHLVENIPSFETTVDSLVFLTAAAGLVFGLLLPHVSRALWAASLGTVFFGLGTTALLKQFAPSVLGWLKANPTAGWLILGLIWAVSLSYNILTCRRKKTAKSPEKPETEAEHEPAVA